MIRKEALLIEIKESTKILYSEYPVKKLIEENYHFHINEFIALDFLEDECTEDLIWHLYHKKSETIYYCIYNPIEDAITSFSKISDMDYLRKTCFTFSVLNDYLNLSKDEIDSLN